MLTVLTGFMGSGKTSVGESLAGMLGCPFLDLDSLVEKAAGKRIPQIFAEDGESRFRALESETLRKTVTKYSRTDAVLALGGGTSCNLEKSLTIWLRTSPETLLQRLQGTAASRPLLAGHDLKTRIAELLAERESAYEASADIIIDTDGLTPEDIAQEIILTAL
ncbi:MAG: shikimate kinase [Bacteroidales bacterium]|nr:shikimate kinase [Bacteroidales bacterium]